MLLVGVFLLLNFQYLIHEFVNLFGFWFGGLDDLRFGFHDYSFDDVLVDFPIFFLSIPLEGNNEGKENVQIDVGSTLA